MTSSGARANKSGNQLEQTVEDRLVRLGYTEIIQNKNQVFANRAAISGKQFVKQIPVGLTIYETKRIADFLVINNSKFPDGLIIECKWQQSSGSVDEKYPYLLFNILKTRVPSIVVLDGGGYKKAAKEWLANQVHKDTNQTLLGVWEISEFFKEINNGFL